MRAAGPDAPRRDTAPRVSIVIPAKDEAQNLPELLRRVADVGASLGAYEVIVVNDGSRDGSLKLLRAAAARDRHLVVVDLNRNYGQHAAVRAGFEVARGAVVVTLDADLQNPPEEIPRLLEEVAKGYDVVGTVRAARQDDLFRRLASRSINAVTRYSTGGRLTDYGCMLRAYRRPVIEALGDAQENSTFVPLLAEMYAGASTEIPVRHEARRAGGSKYGVVALFALMFDLLTGFSLLPLRATTIVGAVTAVCSFLASLVLIAGRVLYGEQWAVQGVFTLFAVLFFLVGVVILSIGLLGEYVGRIYLEVRRRPRFVVREVIRGDLARDAAGAAR